MTTEERIERLEKNLDGLAKVQDQMMDVLGVTIEGQRRLATRTERMEQSHLETVQTLAKLSDKVSEIGDKVSEIGDKVSDLSDKLSETDDKLNALIRIVDGIVRGKN